MNNEYVTGLHKYLQGQYGSEFKLNEQQFQEKLNNDPKYVNGLYTYLQDQYGSEFTLSPEEFSGKVKKKDQSQNGYGQTQPGSGSKTSQAGKTWQLPGTISRSAGLNQLEEEDKALNVLSKKPTLKFVEDKDLKAEIRSNPKAWTEKVIEKNPSLKAQTIDGVLPGLMDEEPTLESESKQNLEKAKKLVDYTESYDQDFDNLEKESDAFTKVDIKNNPRKYKDAVLNDYLQYLKLKNGEDGQAYLDVKERVDYYKSLGDKLYNDEAYADDLNRYQDLQKEALNKISNNSYAKSIAIENNYDWNYFSKKASDLDTRARLIEKQMNELGVQDGKVLSAPQRQKYDELTSQYNQIQSEFSQLSQETNIDDSVIDQMRNVQQQMNNVRSSIESIDNEEGVNAESIRKYKAEQAANKKAQEEFYNTKADGNVEAFGKGVAMLGQQAAKTFVEGIFDIARMPEIAGEAFGAKGYGWSDKLSETADNINSMVELYNPQLETGDFSNFMKFMNTSGQGLGSVAQFVATGSGASRLAKGLRLSEKGLNTANKTAQFVAAASTSTAQLYNDLIDAGFKPEDAARYSLGGGVVMGAAEMLVSDDELIKNEIKQTFVSALKSGSTTKEAIQNGLSHIGLRSAQIAGGVGKETFEEGVGSLAESFSKEVASTMTGNKIDGIWNLDNFNADAIAGGGGTAFIIEMMKFGPRKGRNSNPFEENLVGYLAENYDKMVDVLSKTHPEDYDKIADRFKKLKDIHDGLKNTPAFNKLSKSDQDHILAQAHAKQVVLDNIKQSGLDKAAFADEIASIDEDIFQTLNGLRSKDTWVDKSKNKENAVQEPSTEEVLPRQQGATTETGGEPQGMGQGVQGEVAPQEGQEVSQESIEAKKADIERRRQDELSQYTEEQLDEAYTVGSTDTIRDRINAKYDLEANQENVTAEQQQISQDVGDVIAEINPPSTLAASVYPVIGEIETAIENNEAVNEDKLVDAENKLYSLLDEIDSRQDLNPDQKKRMSEVIENRITKLQNYDNRTRTETSTTTQAVAARRVEKAQGKNERAAIPVRTVAEEGIDVTYDGRAGRIELRDGQYVFVPKKLGAVQARPIVIGEAAQVNANSTFAGVENPTSGPNAVVANITLPNGSTLSVLNDDLSVDIGLEIAKQEVGAAPQALFDVVFDEVVSEQKREVPVQKKEEAAPVQAEEEVQEAPVAEQQAPAVESGKAPYTGVAKEDRALKEKVKDDFRKRRILDQAQRIAMALGNSTPIFIHETTDDYNSALSERGLDMSKDSSNGKFVYAPDGSVAEIHIDLSKANERTIPHEAVHAVLFKAFGDNQALFQDFKNRLKPLLEKSTVKQLEDFANSPAYVTEGVTAEEFMAELGGMMTAQGNRIPKTTLQKIAKLINEFVDKITKGKLKVFEDTARTSDVVDFFNSMADAFAKGKSIQSLIDGKGLVGSGKINGNIRSKQRINQELPEQQERTANFSKVKTIKLADLNDKTGVLTGSDRLTTATLKLPDGTTMTLKGGIFYPSETGLIWASTDITGASELAKKINEVIEAQGEAWLFPVNNAYGSQKSNYTFFEVAMNHLKVAVKQRSVKKDDLINKLKKFKGTKKYENAFKSGYTPKSFTQSLSNKNLEQIYDMLHEDFLPENATYPGRLSFIESFFGGPDTKSRPFDSVPNTAELIEMTTEPVNKDVRSFTTSSAIKITGKVNPRETSNESDGELFHSSYPAIIETNGEVESYVLDNTYPIEEVFPEFTKANGEVVNWEDVKKEQIEKGNQPTFENYKNKIISAQGSIPRSAKIKSKSQVTQQEAEDYISKLREEKAKDANRGIPEMWSVSEPPIQDVKDGTIIKVEGGEAIVDKTGDIRGLYKYVDTEEKKVGDKLIKKAIDAGGIKLDNFALPNLMNIYQRNGFRVTSRLPFSKEFAPTGWTEDKHGNLTPDVVAMIYDPENKLDIEEKQFEDYDEAMAYRDSFIDDQNNAYPQGMKSKSQQESIPKAKSQESSMVSEINEAMNKTGLAKDNSVKRFIEKYGQNGLVAKQIIDNFDKIQEQLGITKICNI